MAKPRVILWARSLSLGMSLALGVGLFAGCLDDPQDPKTWIKKLDDVREQKEAIRQLERLATSKDRPPDIETAVGPLTALFKKTKDPQHLQAVTKIRSEKALDLLIEQLDYSDDNFENASVAATGILELANRDDQGREAAKRAVPDLIKALEKKLPIKTRANVVKVEVMKALTVIKDPAAVPALDKVIETSADEQDFFLNKEAARHLGVFADARSVPSLVRGLFMTGRGSDIFSPCRIALVRIGEPSVDKVIEALQGKNAALNEDAKKGEFLPGLVVQKMSIILGDLRSKKALPALLAELNKKDEGMAPDCLSGVKQCVSGHQSVIQAIGLIGDVSAAKTVLGILNDPKKHNKLRAAAAEALNFMGATEGLPAMLAAAKTPYVKPAKTKDDLPEIDVEKATLAVQAVTQFSRLADTDQMAAVEPLAKAAPIDTDAYVAFHNAVARIEAVAKCKKDAACYGGLFEFEAKEMERLEGTKAGKDELEKVKIDIDKAKSSARAEKAAFMLSRMGHDNVGVLVKNIAYKDTTVRTAILFALTRVATAKDTDAIKAINAQIDIDRTKDKVGQAMADEERIAAAIVAHR